MTRNLRELLDFFANFPGLQRLVGGAVASFCSFENDTFRYKLPLSCPYVDVFIVCYSVISPTSLDNVGKWVEEIRHCCPNSPFMLVGTKSDLRTDLRALEKLKATGASLVHIGHAKDKGQELAALRVMECSAKTRVGLMDVLEEAVQVSLPARCIAAPIPATFGLHQHMPGRQWLHDTRELTAATATEVKALATLLGADPTAPPPQSDGQTVVLDLAQRMALMALLDRRHTEEEHLKQTTTTGGSITDFCLTLTVAEVVAVIGATALQRLEAAFDGVYDVIRARRVSAHGWSSGIMCARLGGDRWGEVARIVRVTWAGKRGVRGG